MPKFHTRHLILRIPQPSDRLFTVLFDFGLCLAQDSFELGEQDRAQKSKRESIRANDEMMRWTPPQQRRDDSVGVENEAHRQKPAGSADQPFEKHRVKLGMVPSFRVRHCFGVIPNSRRKTVAKYCPLEKPQARATLVIDS